MSPVLRVRLKQQVTVSFWALGSGKMMQVLHSVLTSLPS